MASIMQRRMVRSHIPPRSSLTIANRSLQLSKEDEAADEVEVRREDQDKINKFSRLHQRELALKEVLELKSVWKPFIVSRI